MRALAPATESDGGAIRNVVPSSSFFFDGREWRVDALCGRGGTAEVWHAITRDGREVALKRLNAELRKLARADELLRREYELLRTVASPQLVTALGLIERDAGLELVLEYLPNGDLVPLLGSAPRHWLPAMRSVAAAVEKLHEHGFAHGDIKPRNVVFAADGAARLIDLTSARPLDGPAGRGTAAYGPPSLNTTARAADCFALAAVLYELVTARLPYGMDGPSKVARWEVVVRPADPVADRLLAAAEATLEAGGSAPLGLSYLADVIESVGATGA